MLPVLFGLSVAGSLTVAYVGWRMIRSPVAWDRFEDEAHEPQADVPAGSRTPFVGRLARAVGPLAVSLAGERVLDRYRQQLQAAGHPQRVTAESFVARKALYTVAFAAVGGLLALGGAPILAVGLVLGGFLLQDLWLGREVRRRQGALERELPDFLDVLSITVEAGLGFQSALSRVCEAFRGPLAEEIETTLQQMSFGMPRREALEGLRRRNDSEILDQFVTALLQAEELGAPLAGTLRGLADDLREHWYQQARRRAARAAPRISLIVSFTLMPASMMVIITAIVLSAGVDLEFLR